MNENGGERNSNLQYIQGSNVLHRSKWYSAVNTNTLGQADITLH